MSRIAVFETDTDAMLFMRLKGEDRYTVCPSLTDGYPWAVREKEAHEIVERDPWDRTIENNIFDGPFFVYPSTHDTYETYVAGDDFIGPLEFKPIEDIPWGEYTPDAGLTPIPGMLGSREEPTDYKPSPMSYDDEPGDDVGRD